MPSKRATRNTAPAFEPPPRLEKVPTGIAGFDDLTGGGLPRGRTTLVAGGPGCGKTLFGLEFLMRGAVTHGDRGVFVSFEEREHELAQNVASLGFDLPRLVAERRVFVDHVRIERSEIEETGDYDLEGLFIRLGHAIEHVKAKRIVLDTIEALFSAFPNEQILRSELRRLFRWLKDKGVTAVITAERGDDRQVTRHGIEEYVSDCVILLDHRVSGQVSTRRLRVVKYRGSAHGTNEYPFLIGPSGMSVLPITSLGLNHAVNSTRVSTGLTTLDDMLGGGYFKGSSILVSGTPGSGKTSIACHFVDAACDRGERCLYFPFEESPAQIVRNMRSIGLDLGKWVSRGLLQFQAARPQAHGIETHLAIMHRHIDAFTPAIVVIDPLTNLVQAGDAADAQALIARVIDLLKSRGVTALFTSLSSDVGNPEHTDIGVSSLMDTWLLLRNLETLGERNRGLYVLKSRGTAHSNQIREFRLSATGAHILDVYQGPGGVLAGTARLVQESRDRETALMEQQEQERRRRDVERRRVALEARIATMRAEFAAEEGEYQMQVSDATRVDHDRRAAQDALSALRALGTLGDNGGRGQTDAPAGRRRGPKADVRRR